MATFNGWIAAGLFSRAIFLPAIRRDGAEDFGLNTVETSFVTFASLGYLMSRGYSQAFVLSCARRTGSDIERSSIRRLHGYGQFGGGVNGEWQF